jgi:cellulose synthase/poly-beta-1,6-N-acetylglucosamine synthase-like glycosyltransferase
MAASRPRVTAAVCAYNEAANIGGLLQTLLTRDRQAFEELIVVSSGSTDATDEIVRSYESESAGVRLITEPRRLGKAHAVNIILREARGEAILLIDADCLPAEGVLERLAARLAAPGVGGAGSRNLPTNAADSFVARAGAVLWELHHAVNLERPVLGGDIVAFRKVLQSIPEDTVNDDYAIEAALRAMGYHIEYEPEAIVHMRVPSTLSDFLKQRRRIYAGFRAESQPERPKTTQEWPAALRAMARLIRQRPSRMPALSLLVLLEATARISVFAESVLKNRRPYTSWEPAGTTKGRLETDGREKAP